MILQDFAETKSNKLHTRVAKGVVSAWEQCGESATGVAAKMPSTFVDALLLTMGRAV